MISVFFTSCKSYFLPIIFRDIGMIMKFCDECLMFTLKDSQNLYYIMGILFCILKTCTSLITPSPQILQIWIQIVRAVSKNIRLPLSDFLAQTLEKKIQKEFTKIMFAKKPNCQGKYFVRAAFTSSICLK